MLKNMSYDAEDNGDCRLRRNQVRFRKKPLKDGGRTDPSDTSDGCAWIGEDDVNEAHEALCL